MSDLDQLVSRLEELMVELDRLEEPTRSHVLELLDGVDAVHRMALRRLPEVLGTEMVSGLRSSDPAFAWLLDAYGVDVDERRSAEEALETIRPFIHSHGGSVEVISASDGVVRVRLAGSCSGCTASAVTLREGVVKALQEGFPGFASLEVEEDDAPDHPPPGPTLLQIENVSPG